MKKASTVSLGFSYSQEVPDQYDDVVEGQPQPTSHC